MKVVQIIDLDEDKPYGGCLGLGTPQRQPAAERIWFAWSCECAA
jgi:hypothetical protein